MLDSLQTFICEDAPVRGAIVRLDESWRTIVSQRPYPLPVANLLAEAVCANVLMGSSIKWDGRLLLQYQGGAVIPLLVAKSNHRREVCAMAKWNEPLSASSMQLITEGQLVVTILQDDQVTPYQSLVPINAGGLADSLRDYFSQSEQLPTFFWLAGSMEHGFGLMVQMMPEEGQASFDFEALVKTVSSQSIDFLKTNETLLRDCFTNNVMRLFEPQPIIFKCSCSLEKMQQAIITLGETHARETLAAQKELEVTCDFCNHSYVFTRDEIDAIFS